MVIYMYIVNKKIALHAVFLSAQSDNKLEFRFQEFQK